MRDSAMARGFKCLLAGMLPQLGLPCNQLTRTELIQSMGGLE